MKSLARWLDECARLMLDQATRTAHVIAGLDDGYNGFEDLKDQSIHITNGGVLGLFGQKYIQADILSWAL